MPALNTNRPIDGFARHGLLGNRNSKLSEHVLVVYQHHLHAIPSGVVLGQVNEQLVLCDGCFAGTGLVPAPSPFVHPLLVSILFLEPLPAYAHTRPRTSRNGLGNLFPSAIPRRALGGAEEVVLLLGPRGANARIGAGRWCWHWLRRRRIQHRPHPFGIHNRHDASLFLRIRKGRACNDPFKVWVERGVLFASALPIVPE